MQQEEVKYYLDLIDKSLEGKLSTTEESKLKSELGKSEILKEIAEEHVLARANIRVAGEKELKKKFGSKFHSLNNLESKTLQETKTFTPYYFFAFLLIALIMGAMYLIKQFDNAKIPMVQEMASVEDPSYDLFRSSDSSGMAVAWDKAVEFFVAKDYTATIQTLKSIDQDTTFIYQHSGKMALIKGVSFMRLNNYSDAEKGLLAIANDNPYYDQAEWFLALNYFYSNQHAKAISVFTKIKNNQNHFKATSASKYLEFLNN